MVGSYLLAPLAPAPRPDRAVWRSLPATTLMVVQRSTSWVTGTTQMMPIQAQSCLGFAG